MFTLTGDLRFYYEPTAAELSGAVIKADGVDLARDPGFETAVLISLGTDARADESDTLPGTSETRRGHWSEVVSGFNIGSKLWLLERSKLDKTTLRLAEQYVNECLAWMVEDRIVEAVDTVASRGSISQINFITEFKRPKGGVTFKWFANWEYQIIGGLE